MVLDVVETAMAAIVRSYSNGNLVWTVTGSNDDGLTLEGDVPVDMTKVREAFEVEMKNLNLGDDFEADFEEDPFGLAVQVFVELTGFRYDAVHELPFTELHGEMLGKKREHDAQKSWWKLW